MNGPQREMTEYEKQKYFGMRNVGMTPSLVQQPREDCAPCTPKMREGSVADLLEQQSKLLAQLDETLACLRIELSSVILSVPQPCTNDKNELSQQLPSDVTSQLHDHNKRLTQLRNGITVLSNSLTLK